MTDPKRTSSSEHGDDSLPEAERPLPPIDFTTFVLSLSTSALMHMGLSPAPSGDVPVDLALARQTIDLIHLLHDKTRGNLSGEEERLLDRVLVDLRMKFVATFERAHKK